MHRFFGPGLLNSGKMGVSQALWSKEGTSHWGDLFLAVKETKEGQSALSSPAAFQVTLIRNNQYATVRYLALHALGTDSAVLKNKINKLLSFLGGVRKMKSIF